MKKRILVLILLTALIFTFTNGTQAKRSTIATMVEFQTIDIGGFWIGGQLNPNSAIEIPGRHFQPDKISLNFLKKTQGYEGWQIRGSLDYNMNENFYNGYGLGVAKIEKVNLLLGTAKTGMEIPIMNTINLRGELIGYIPIWNMTDKDDRNSVFYGVNFGLGF